MLRKLLAPGRSTPTRRPSLLNTGDGLKTLDAIAGSGTVGPSATIRPSLDAFRGAIEALPRVPDHAQDREEGRA